MKLQKTTLLFIPIALLLYYYFSYSSPPTEEEKTAISTTVDTLPKDTFPSYNFTLDYLRGRFEPENHPDFMKVPSRLTDKSRVFYLRKDVCAAFEKMHDAAALDSVQLLIISATRNFNRQKSIWEAKWTGARLLEGKENAPKVYPDSKGRALAILRWSSMPGTSRHHWGTDMDINKLNNPYFEKTRGLAEYKWLQAHAIEYDFGQPYSPKGEGKRSGYNEEKWHWSYLPVARQLTKLAQTKLTDGEINGFKGAEAAVEIGVVDKYVLGISQDCK